MEIPESSDRDEILRLRRIVERLEATKGTRVITTEIVPRKDKPGFLIYVTAPTATDEVEFGMAIYHQVLQALRVKAPDAMADVRSEFIYADQAKPAEGLPEVELFAWIGRDELGSGKIGLKQAVVPAGTIPMVANDQGKMEKYWEQAEMLAAVYGQQVSLVKFRPMEVLRRTRQGRP